jgi:ABC-type uncharacterized transport system substrate-binding protein
LANELVEAKVDLIVASGTPAAVAAKQATGSIPIVMTNAAYPEQWVWRRACPIPAATSPASATLRPR